MGTARLWKTPWGPCPSSLSACLDTGETGPGREFTLSPFGLLLIALLEGFGIRESISYIAEHIDRQVRVRLGQLHWRVRTGILGTGSMYTAGHRLPV